MKHQTYLNQARCGCTDGRCNGHHHDVDESYDDAPLNEQANAGLRAAMERLGVSQTELAYRLDVDCETLDNQLHGRIDWPLADFVAACAALNLRPSEVAA